MKDIDGLWIVSFQSNFQTFGTGVAVIMGDRILGGDAFYYYDGNINFQDNLAEASIKIVRFNKTGMAIFGDLDSYNLKISGDITAADLELHGHMVEQPSMKITIKCEKITSI